MGMLEAISAGFTNYFTPSVFLFSLLGVVIGLIFGILPGISSLTAMAIILPLTYGANPLFAIVMLTAIRAVSATGGAITSILINIPGEASSAALCLDGSPMTKKGQGGRAVGAALCASGLGGILGGFVLALLIPVAYPLVLLFGSGETALIGLLGLTFIAVLSQGSVIKGFIAGLLGIILSFIGVHGVTSAIRFTYGNLYLYDGIPLVPLVLGLFAFPEIFDLILKKGGTIADVDRSVIKQTGWPQVYEGMKDVLRHWSLLIRSTVVGIIVGIIPGIGGAVAQFVAYGHAKQTSKHPELFGKGNIEGVIAPGSAVNAEEGGAFVPTLAFGIPGSLAMTLMLAAFLIHGIQPGPAMLTQHLDLTWTIVVALIITNIMGVGLMLPFVSTFARIAFVRSRLVIPVFLVVAAFGAYGSNLEFWDIVISFAFGILGYTMIKSGYDRVAIVLGFILGQMVERYFGIIIAAMGAEFLLRPTSMILVIMIVLLLVYKPINNLIRKGRRRRETP